MSSPTYTEIFESGLCAPSPQFTPYMNSVVRRSLQLATQDMIAAASSSSAMSTVSGAPSAMATPSPSPPPPPSDNRDLLTNLGEYLLRTAVLWSHLTENLITGQHIERFGRELHERSRAETLMADLEPIGIEGANFTRLRKIRDLSAQFSRDVQAIWHPEPLPPEASPAGSSSVSPVTHYKALSVSRSMSMSGTGEPIPLKSRKVLPDSEQQPPAETPPSGNPSESDDSNDDDEQFQAIDMDALRQRGKGAYYCPKGRRCDKGGVDKEGNPVRFDRNSSFIQHCNKHRKPWRCELPGCPNPPKKRKFARRDGLERHKATVKHFVVT